MAKERRPLVDFAVYLVVRIVVCLLQGLSLEAGHAFARGLAWLGYHVDRRHREVARDNLRHAFPGRYDEAQLDELVRRVYRHFCTVLIEIVHLPRKLHNHNWRRYMAQDGGDNAVGTMVSGRPFLIVTGHFGNWEMAGYALGVFGFRSFAVARRLDNPYLDAFMGRFRQATGQTILDKNTDYERIQQVLASGGALAMLADQDAGPRGLFVEYFGRPASTFKSIALLALEYRAVMVVLGVRKVGEPMRYRISVEDLIRPEEFDGRPDAVKALTQRYTAALERIVRRNPEQYFWLHRRWKHQPPIRKSKAA